MTVHKILSCSIQMSQRTLARCGFVGFDPGCAPFCAILCLPTYSFEFFFTFQFGPIPLGIWGTYFFQLCFVVPANAHQYFLFRPDPEDLYPF